MNGAPADDEYAALATRHKNLLVEAGAFLARSLTPAGNASALQIAHDFATEANELAEQMAQWRKRNGWTS